MGDKFFILGTGGLAEEVYGWIKSDIKSDKSSVLGFIKLEEDDPQELFGKKCMSFKEILSQYSEFNFLPAIANPKVKKERIEQAISNNGSPITYIHGSVILGENLSIGFGNIINPRCTISSNVKIGNYNLINCNSSIGHGTKIKNYVSLLGSVTLNGNVLIQDAATIGSGVIVHPGKKVGKNSNCGIGSVIIRNVEDNVTVFGNPAKKLNK